MSFENVCISIMGCVINRISKSCQYINSTKSLTNRPPKASDSVVLNKSALVALGSSQHCNWDKMGEIKQFFATTFKRVLKSISPMEVLLKKFPSDRHSYLKWNQLCTVKALIVSRNQFESVLALINPRLFSSTYARSSLLFIAGAWMLHFNQQLRTILNRNFHSFCFRKVIWLRHYAMLCNKISHT